MTQAYTTVFKASYLSNGFLLWNIGAIAMGITGVTLMIRSRKPGSRNQAPLWFLCFWGSGWFLACSVWLYSNLTQGRRYTAALANDQCQVVEGVVQVLHEQPAAGHDAGDHIRIDDKDFTYSDFVSTLSYNRTISHGGKLTNGAVVRLHYLGFAILKVEIRN